MTYPRRPKSVWRLRVYAVRDLVVRVLSGWPETVMIDFASCIVGPTNLRLYQVIFTMSYVRAA